MTNFPLTNNDLKVFKRTYGNKSIGRENDFSDSPVAYLGKTYNIKAISEKPEVVLNTSCNICKSRNTKPLEKFINGKRYFLCNACHLVFTV